MTKPDSHQPTSSQRWRRAASVLAISMLGVAACGGDDSTDDTDPTLAPTTTAVATTTDATTTTTGAPPETATSTSTSTTVAPTTTEDPAVALAAEVEAAYLESARLVDEAVTDPYNDDLVDAALATAAGDWASTLEARFDELRSLGYRAIPNPDVPTAYTIDIAPSGASEQADRLTVCVLDSNVLVETGAGPGGGDAIVNDQIVSFRVEARLTLTDGSWKVAEVIQLGEWPGVTTCEPL